jgi:DNA-3-methyladenine glycosylase
VSSRTCELLSRSAPVVAADLLGWTLTHVTGQGAVTVRLTEVEAYDGGNDPASHAYRGMTPRNRVMFGPPGRLYVYLSYGMHWCANVVCGPEGRASAVLLRAGQVVAGQHLARRRRGDRVAERRLARGPACLTQALGLDRASNGADLLGADSNPRLQPDALGQPVSSGPRVGISTAADLPWRFWVTDDDTVSVYKRGVRAG